MIEPNETYTAAQVASLLFHITLRTLRRRRRQLAREGFPGPVSRCGSKPVWSGAALLAWRDRALQQTIQGDVVVDFAPILAKRLQALGHKRSSQG